MGLLTALLRLLPAETAHNLAVKAMRRGWFAPGLIDNGRPYWKLFDREINNPVGLAAGFDKYATLPYLHSDYGFGWVEVGSVTWEGGPGNPGRRLFRLPRGHLLNRMGLNGPSAHEVCNLLQARYAPTRFAVSIAKTHDPKIVGDAAIEDICDTYRLMCDKGIYTVINISCPNTAEGKTFEVPDALRELLWELKAIRRWSPVTGRPLLVKLSPFGRLGELEGVVQVCMDCDIDGFVSCNTSRMTHRRYGTGGMSGPALRYQNLPQVAFLKRTQKPIIACGGIRDAADVRTYLAMGAVAVQAYTGFVRGPCAGPRFVHQINAGLSDYAGTLAT